MPLNFMFINKRHIPLNNSLNREHGTPVTLSPQITVHSILASAGIRLHHISVLIGGWRGANLSQKYQVMQAGHTARRTQTFF